MPAAPCDASDEAVFLALAEAVRTACCDAAREGYLSAAMSGLCAEGAQEAALGAIAMVDVTQIVAEAKARTAR